MKAADRLESTHHPRAPKRPSAQAFAVKTKRRLTSASALSTPGHCLPARTQTSQPHAPASGLPGSWPRQLVNKGRGGPAVHGRWAARPRKTKQGAPFEGAFPTAGSLPRPEARPRQTPGARPAETARSTRSASPTAAAAGARWAPSCRPGPTNAGRGGEVRAADGACEQLEGRRGEAARGEGRSEETPRPWLEAGPGGAPLGVFAPFPLEGADGSTPHPD